MTKFGNVQPSLDNSEHIGPDTTGDNIQAKKVAPYYWDGTNWQRQGGKLSPKTNYDYIDVQQTSATVETYVYKLGGSGGTIVQTITVTYVDSTKADIDYVGFS